MPPERILGFFAVIASTLLCFEILPAIGEVVMMLLDRIAFGFRCIGVNNPAFAWLLLGALVGAVAGFAMGLGRAGAPRLRPKVALYGVGAMGCLFILGLIYCATMPPTHPKPVTATNGHSVTISLWVP